MPPLRSGQRCAAAARPAAPEGLTRQAQRRPALQRRIGARRSRRPRRPTEQPGAAAAEGPAQRRARTEGSETAGGRARRGPLPSREKLVRRRGSASLPGSSEPRASRSRLRRAGLSPPRGSAPRPPPVRAAGAGAAGGGWRRKVQRRKFCYIRTHGKCRPRCSAPCRASPAVRPPCSVGRSHPHFSGCGISDHQHQVCSSFASSPACFIFGWPLLESQSH